MSPPLPPTALQGPLWRFWLFDEAQAQVLSPKFGGHPVVMPLADGQPCGQCMQLLPHGERRPVPRSPGHGACLSDGLGWVTQDCAAAGPGTAPGWWVTPLAVCAALGAGATACLALRHRRRPRPLHPRGPPLDMAALLAPPGPCGGPQDHHKCSGAGIVEPPPSLKPSPGRRGPGLSKEGTPRDGEYWWGWPLEDSEVVPPFWDSARSCPAAVRGGPSRPPPPLGVSQKMLAVLCPLEPPQKRQEPEVWEQLAQLKLPGAQRDFMRRALWKKLAVGARTQHAYHQPNCILCSVPETIKHVLAACKFWPVAVDIVRKAFGPVWGRDGAMCSMDTLLVAQPLLSLSTTQGLALWAAARASWVLRCDAKFRSLSVAMPDFVVAWMTLVEVWA